MRKKNMLYTRNLKQTLSHGLVLKKVHRIIKFNEKGWLKPYIDMNTELRKKLMNNVVFGKPMKNVRKHFLRKTISHRNEKTTNIHE